MPSEARSQENLQCLLTYCSLASWPLRASIATASLTILCFCRRRDEPRALVSPSTQKVLSKYIGVIMTKDIDDVLVEKFNEDRINQLFYRLKYSKWNRFSDIDDPEINIAMGADGVTFEAFEIQLERQARNICSRVHNDKYIFYPFRELDIEKEPAQNGQPAKYRTLSIASIRDNLVQSLLYEDVLYEPLEELFKILDKAKPVSFAYRKGKSAPKAALEVNNYTSDMTV